jgi:surface polysaccharide O-acyltransferase-like enzyme
MKKALLILSLILGTFLISRFVFEPANLYYELPWLDVPMHILGGYLIGALFIALGTKNKTIASKSFFFWGLFLVMVAWEFFEYKRGMVEYDELYDYFDSIKDVLFGYLGAYIAYKRK